MAPRLRYRTQTNVQSRLQGWGCATLSAVTMPSLRHILDARQFTRDWLETVLFPRTQRLQETPTTQLPRPLDDRRLFYLFYEPSTRTRVSFEAGCVIAWARRHRYRQSRADCRTKSAWRIGSGCSTSTRTISSAALSRRRRCESRAAAVSAVPVINAGDGPVQHPTQALLDAYTLWREFGRIDGLRIALVGDLSYERSTNSLAYLLSQFHGLKVSLVSPQLLRMRDEVAGHIVEASGAEVRGSARPALGRRAG